jgi:cation diffusion facilitator CzcD-associated flavoprotein CzcO
MDSKDTKHVCVIGAGVSGICVLRHLSGCKNISVTAFERSYTFGGLWQNNLLKQAIVLARV